jgi:hypothetical protein
MHSIDIGDPSSFGAFAHCLPGERVLGGGGDVVPWITDGHVGTGLSTDHAIINTSRPYQDLINLETGETVDAWYAGALVPLSQDETWMIVAFAVCAQLN